MVAMITLSTGIGARKGIKEKLADFNGHITVNPYNSNLSFNSESVSLHPDFYRALREVPDFELIQAIATMRGIIRTADIVGGIVLKGVGSDFDQNRFVRYIIKGKFPKI